MKTNQLISPAITELLIRDAGRYQAIREFGLMPCADQDGIFDGLDELPTPENAAEFDAHTDILIDFLRKARITAPPPTFGDFVAPAEL